MTVWLGRVGTSSWVSVYSYSFSFSTKMACTCLSLLGLFMWVCLDIGLIILIIFLWLCITCLYSYGCLLAIYLTIILLTNWLQVVAVCPFFPQTWRFYSLVRLFNGKYSSSVSSYWTLWAPWTVLFGVSICRSFAHIL